MNQKPRLSFFSSLKFENNNNNFLPAKPSLRPTESYYPKELQTEAEKLYYNSYFLPTQGKKNSLYETESFYPVHTLSRSSSSLPNSPASLRFGLNNSQIASSSSNFSSKYSNVASSSLPSTEILPILKKSKSNLAQKTTKKVSGLEPTGEYELNQYFYGDVKFRENGNPIYNIFRNKKGQIRDKSGRRLIHNTELNKYRKKPNGVPINIYSVQHIKNNHSQQINEIMKQKALNLMNAKKSLFENFDNIYIPENEFQEYYKKLYSLFNSEPEKKERIIQNYIKQRIKIPNLKKKERQRLMQLNSIFSNTDSLKELKQKYNHLAKIYKNNQELLQKIKRNYNGLRSKKKKEANEYQNFKSEIIGNSQLGLMNNNPFRIRNSKK